MALDSSSTVANAIAQYQDNLRYWESAAKAADLYEAILYLLQGEPESYMIAGRSVKRRELQDLRDELKGRVIGASDTRRRSFTTARAV